MTKHYCDRCGKESRYPAYPTEHADDVLRSVSISATWPAPPVEPQACRRDSLAELCGACQKALRKWLEKS